MNKKSILALTIAGVFVLALQSYINAGFHHIAGNAPYYHKDTLNDPILFGKGVITTSDDEFGGAFTPDGNTCYFSKSVLRFYIDVICFSQFKNGKWQTPEVAPFSGRYRDFDPV